MDKRTSTQNAPMAQNDKIRSAAMLDRILDSSAFAVIVFDRDFYIVDVGQGLCDLLGYTRKELMGQHAAYIIDPAQREAGEAALQNLAESDKGAYSVERRYMHKDGTPVWALSSVSKMGGNPGPGEPFFIVQMTSINKQKQAEAKAAEALERWDFALEGAGQGIWDYDITTSEWYFSPTWKRMRGIPDDEYVDGNDEGWFDVLHPDDREHVAKNIELQNSGKMRVVAYEYRERHRDGHWMWILARGCCVEWQENGKPKRIIGTDTDITGIKERELELASLSERLELALSTSTVGVWETYLDTYETIWDERSYEIFGLDPSLKPLPPNIWEDLMHPEDRDAVIKTTDKAIEKREKFNLDYRIITPAGEVRHIRCKAGFTIDSSGREKMIGVEWDVSIDVERANALEHANQLAERRNDQLETAKADMEHASLHDSLTGLPNRRFLDNALAEHAAKKVDKQDLSLLHIDLDRFKEINDTKGHAAGDAMLMYTSELLRDSVGESGFVARIGGDEFVIMLSPAPDHAQMSALVRNIIERAREPMMWQGNECRGSVSIGIAESRAGVDPKQLLINADIALYRAKRDGRNRAAYFSDALQAEITSRKQCADDILKGLEKDEFIPFFQPQFDARTLEISGAEALVRWQHPKRGLLAPDQFLDVAEDLQAVGTIDRMILEQSLVHLADWDQRGLNIPQVSINVSSRRLSDEKLIDSLRSLNIERGRVAFELLESIFLDDQDDVMSFNIDAIKELGIDIDIDDFGTGHASIVSLLRLSPHRLKIDREIVAPITESAAQRKLVQSIVDIGKSQGIEVCAEGVETVQHVEILRDLGCDILQGYFFSGPVSADSFVEYVHRKAWRRVS